MLATEWSSTKIFVKWVIQLNLYNVIKFFRKQKICNGCNKIPSSGFVNLAMTKIPIFDQKSCRAIQPVKLLSNQMCRSAILFLQRWYKLSNTIWKNNLWNRPLNIYAYFRRIKRQNRVLLHFSPILFLQKQFFT